MKKIAIITIYDLNNFGNRLQNYAVQEILKKRGFEVETLENINIIDGKNYLEIGLSSNQKRREAFFDFNKNINVAKEVIYHNEVPKDFGDRYDYFVIGSDQIWNYDFEDRFSNFTFAPFASKEKRIAISASFGTDIIPEDKMHLYEGLKDMNAISVREDAGKEIVKHITGREDVSVVIDPTMLLDKEEWKKIMKKPDNFSSKKYILKYFLGTTSTERNDEIKRIAKENDCDIIDVMDKNSFYGIGPAELIYLYQNAFLVVTDSFHSCIFSLIFDKPFVIFERKNASINMNSRLETFLTKFNLKDRIYNGKIGNDMLEIDYEGAYQILEEEKAKFNEFIDIAVEGKVLELK